MPPIQCINIYFMKEILAMKKKALKTDAVKVFYAPQYESLSVDKLLDFAAAYPGIYEYLPIDKDVRQLPRQVSTHLIFICSADPVCICAVAI